MTHFRSHWVLARSSMASAVYGTRSAGHTCHGGNLAVAGRVLGLLKPPDRICMREFNSFVLPMPFHGAWVCMFAAQIQRMFGKVQA